MMMMIWCACVGLSVFSVYVACKRLWRHIVQGLVTSLSAPVFLHFYVQIILNKCTAENICLRCLFLYIPPTIYDAFTCCCFFYFSICFFITVR